MKDSKKLKKELDNLKREISSLSYYIEHTQPNAHDGFSAKNHQNSRAVLDTVNYLLKTKFRDFDAEIQKGITADKHTAYMNRMGTINSPTNNMMKQSSDNIEFAGLIKKSVKRKTDGVPQQNIRKSSTHPEAR